MYLVHVHQHLDFEKKGYRHLTAFGRMSSGFHWNHANLCFLVDLPRIYSCICYHKAPCHLFLNAQNRQAVIRVVDWCIFQEVQIVLCVGGYAVDYENTIGKRRQGKISLLSLINTKCDFVSEVYFQKDVYSVLQIIYVSNNVKGFRLNNLYIRNDSLLELSICLT